MLSLSRICGGDSPYEILPRPTRHIYPASAGMIRPIFFLYKFALHLLRMCGDDSATEYISQRNNALYPAYAGMIFIDKKQQPHKSMCGCFNFYDYINFYLQNVRKYIDN